MVSPKLLKSSVVGALTCRQGAASETAERHCGAAWQPLTLSNTGFPYDPTVPAPHVHPREFKIHAYTKTCAQIQRYDSQNGHQLMAKCDKPLRGSTIRT